VLKVLHTNDSHSARYSSDFGAGLCSGLPLQSWLGILSEWHIGNDSADRLDSVLAALRLKGLALPLRQSRFGIAYWLFRFGKCS